jgi:hypothetical protein
MAGDLAEAKVMEFMQTIDRPVQHFGAKHVPTERAQATTWTPKIRHAPDFLGWAKFFEVQGCWNKHVIFKVDKLTYQKLRLIENSGTVFSFSRYPD